VKKKREELKEDSIDFLGLLNKFISKWYYFAIGLILAYLGAKFYIFYYTQPIYRVSTTLLTKDQSNAIRVLGGAGVGGERTLANEVGVIKSFDMIMKVIAELDFDVSYFHSGNVKTRELYKENPYKVVLDTSSFQISNVPFFITFLSQNKFRLEASINNANVYDVETNNIMFKSEYIQINEVLEFGKPYKNKNIAFTVFLRDPNFIQHESKLYFVINDRTSLTLAYKNKLSVNQPFKDATLLEMSTSGPILAKDLDFINKVADIYIQNGLEEKNKIWTNTINFIDEQLIDISSTMKLAEKEMQEMKGSLRGVNLDRSVDAAYTKLEAIENQKTEILLNHEYYYYILDYIRSNRDIKEISAPSAIGIGDPVLGALIGQLIGMKTERALLAKNAKPNNPYIISLDTKIKITTETLEENLKEIINGNELKLKDLNKRIYQIESNLETIPASERKFLEIQRRFKLNDNLYTYLLERRAEAGISKASNQPDAKVLDKARLMNSAQIAPKLNLIYTSAFMLGLIVPFVIILILDFLNNKVMSRQNLQSITDIPILGIVGHSDLKSNLIVLDKPKSGIAESFRSIRINLSYIAPELDKKVIAISSSISGEGKTFCSVNLASIIALSGKKTLLMGADLRKPKIYDDFGFTNIKGISTYLARKSNIDEIINKTKVDNLDVMLSGAVPPNPAELLGSPRLEEMINDLRNRYDYIIMDTPPIGLVADSFLLIKYSDINIYIVRHDYTETRLLEKIDGLYEDGKVKNLSIIINDLYAKDAKYGYGYEYGYGYYNGYGYYEEDSSAENNIIMKALNKIKSIVKA
jgi:tyrosine-protein kinase Etk/Wzc